MNSKQLKQILKSLITKAAKGCFISIEELEQIKTILEAWEIIKNKLILKVQIVETINEESKKYQLHIEQYPFILVTILEQEEYDIFKKLLEVEDE